MMELIAKFILSVLGLLVIANYIPGIELQSLYIAVIVAIIFGILNLTLKPVLHLLTLPITILTFGLFALVVNAALFWFVASFVQGFVVEGFIAAFLGALAYSLLSWLIDRVF